MKWLSSARGRLLKRYGGKISSEWMFPKNYGDLCDAPELYGETGSFMEAFDWIVMLLTGRMTRNTSSPWI